MNLHEALAIFGLDYQTYTHQEVEKAYALCKILAPEPMWQDDLDEGKSILEDALRAQSTPNTEDMSTHTAAQELSQLRQGPYVPSPNFDARKPSSMFYNRIPLFKIPDIYSRMEAVSPSLIPLLAKVCTEFSIDDPQAIPPRTTGHLTIFWDLDETLVFARGGPIFLRPYAKAVLRIVSELEDADGRPAVEHILFSAGNRQHVDLCLRTIDPQHKLFKYSICRGDNWANSLYPLKDLSLLSRGDSCLLVDDSLFASIKNGHRALLTPAFRPIDPQATNDKTLLYVLDVITRVSHNLSHPEPIAYPTPRFGCSCVLERPDLAAKFDAISKKISPSDASIDSAAAILQFKQARHAKISTLLAAARDKITTHIQANKRFTDEAIPMLLQDRLFVSAMYAVESKLPLVEAAKYLVRITRDAGKLTAADLAAAHPFMRVNAVHEPTSGLTLNCLCLNIPSLDVLMARTRPFLAKQIAYHIEMTAERTHPLAIYAAQIDGKQLLELFKEAEEWWAKNEESALDTPGPITIPARPQVTQPLPPRTVAKRVSPPESIPPSKPSTSVLVRSSDFIVPLEVLNTLPPYRHSNSLLVAECSFWSKVINKQRTQKWLAEDPSRSLALIIK